MDYRADIGLEVHVQLKTQSKMFCACAARYGEAPNTRVCPVCLGYPGAMPVMNEHAVALTVKTGLALGCAISPISTFDRKSYFYPDMPKNYQISQFDKPLCVGGVVAVDVEGRVRDIRIRRIHLEEDVAKNMHYRNVSGVDFNRAGVPLMEIVSEPDMTSPDEALAFLHALKQVLLYTGVSDCNLEEGNIRCDVNSSVRPTTASELGTKAEIKNLNTFRGVHHALTYDVRRQVALLEQGGAVAHETRRWDADAGVTATMRSKELAHDYRYFPEPDLMPVVLPIAQVEAWRAELPELPASRRERLVRDYGLPAYDAEVLVADRGVADFFEEAAANGTDYKGLSNWIMTDMLRLLADRKTALADVPMTPAALADLVALVNEKTISRTTAKELFETLFEQGGDPREWIEARGLARVSDGAEIEAYADRALSEHPKSVSDYARGKKTALKFLIGQVMRLSRGTADPQVVARVLTARMEVEKETDGA